MKSSDLIQKLEWGMYDGVMSSNRFTYTDHTLYYIKCAGDNETDPDADNGMVIPKPPKRFQRPSRGRDKEYYPLVSFFPETKVGYVSNWEIKTSSECKDLIKRVKEAWSLTHTDPCNRILLKNEGIYITWILVGWVRCP